MKHAQVVQKLSRVRVQAPKMDHTAAYTTEQEKNRTNMTDEYNNMLTYDIPNPINKSASLWQCDAPISFFKKKM